ncbi:MAG: 6-bladed beta-propeller, partial [Vicinamibacterales bacterium]
VRSLTPGEVQRRPSALTRVFNAIVGGGRGIPSMSQPYGVAVGPDKRIYVADSTGGLVHVYDVEHERYSSLEVKGAKSLIGVAFAGDLLIVTDSEDGSVKALTLDGTLQWTLGRKAGFERPTGIAATPDRIYVVDTARHQVVFLDPFGVIQGWFGLRGDAHGEFNYPTNIASGADGLVYVTDSMNFRVQVFDRDGRYRSSFGRLGDSAGDFTKPKGIALDSEGHVYVVEGLNDFVQVFDAQGRLLLAFGGSGVAPGQFWLPTGIAITNDHVYVVDAANHRVQEFDYLRGRG